MAQKHSPLKTPVDNPLPSKRPVDVDHYGDLIAVRLAACNLLDHLPADRDSPCAKTLEAALKFSLARRP
jgi:hypothetical protein